LKPGDLNPDGSWVSPEIAFQRAEQNNKILIRNNNSRVKPEDTVVCVGDFSCRGGERGVQGLHVAPAEILSQLNGKYIIVGGNHDDNNGVKVQCEFMMVEMGRYRVGVQHRPLYDKTAYERWLSQPLGVREAAPWRDKMYPMERERQNYHTEYCRKVCDFMIVGHVHNNWKTRCIAGVWHVNVGVDVNRYMPISDQEVIRIFEKAVKENERKKDSDVSTYRFLCWVNKNGEEVKEGTTETAGVKTCTKGKMKGLTNRL